MNFKSLLWTVALLASLTCAARMTVTSYGIPHIFPLNPEDEITFDPSGLLATIRTPGSPAIIRKVYLGYSNRVTLDAVGGAFANIYINGLDETQQAFDLASIDSLVLQPRMDESGDEDGDKLTTFSEFMLYFTDPKKPDSDGDGLSDEWEVLRDPKVYSPVVANLPQVAIEMNKRPEIYLITNKSQSKSEEYTVTEGTSWETSESSTKSDASSFTNENSVGVSVSVGAEATAGILGGFQASFEVTSSYDHSWGSSNTHEVSISQQQTTQTNLDHAKSNASENGEQITGGRLSVSVKMTNVGTIGVKLGEPTFNFFGVQDGRAEHLKDLKLATAVANQDLQAGVSGIDVELTTKSDLTLAEVEKIASYGTYMVVMTHPAMTYKPELNSDDYLSLTDVMTNVNAATAHVNVDFNDCLPGQESPFSRNVATLTKYNPTAGSRAETYGPVYLGELLTNMGLTYAYDSLGFKHINGLERDANNLWSTQIIHSRGLGGQKPDTAFLLLGNPGGPDSVVVQTGDWVNLTYSGDDDRDSVSNALAKFYDIYASANNVPVAVNDFDGDGITNHNEIFGWKPAGASKVVRTDPKMADTDLDGINDAEDTEPTVRRKASHADLQSFAVWSNGAVVTTVDAPYAATNAITKNLPAQPILLARVDSLAYWVKFVVNGDSLRATFDSSNASGYWYSYKYSKSNLKILALSATSIDVVTLSDDRTRLSSWKFNGTSKLYNGLAAPTLAAVRDSNVVEVHPVNVSELQTLEPRAKGFLLFRSASPSATLDLTDRTTGLQMGDVVTGNWKYVAAFTDMNVTNYVDSYEIAEGTNYTYTLVAYTSNANSVYFYSPSSPTASVGTLYCPRWLVTRVGVVYNSSPIAANATKVAVDLNSGAGGDYVYVEYTRELVKFSENKQIITDLAAGNGELMLVLVFGAANGYTTIANDLNQGTKVHNSAVYLQYKVKDSNVAENFVRGISKIDVVINGVVPNNNWEYVRWNGTGEIADCNEGANGRNPYIIYTRSQSE